MPFEQHPDNAAARGCTARGWCTPRQRLHCQRLHCQRLHCRGCSRREGGRDIRARIIYSPKTSRSFLPPWGTHGNPWGLGEPTGRHWGPVTTPWGSHGTHGTYGEPPKGECLFCFKSLRRRCGWPSARCAAAASFRRASKLNICASKSAYRMSKLAEPNSTSQRRG